MHCPNDNTVLQMTTREGIEIDYCPTCRGVWLDRGELDKLIERTTAYGGGAPAQAQQFAGPAPDRHSQPQQQSNQQYRPYDDDDDHKGGYHEGGHHNNHGHHKKKKEGFLGDLFDF